MTEVTCYIDGQAVRTTAGARLIDVADSAGVPLPRFCYHDKLSVAANCRMCLVDIEGMAKPMPACATIVSDGMKVRTKSEKAVSAQQSVMEFLLINHPLDCPICDQGGECELQDVAMGFGVPHSSFHDIKRVSIDHDIGPLIATELTRCIQCTRCVRFGQEVAGVMELGLTGRGTHTQIETFLHASVDSELSGNVIDLCPVGALTAKPSRFNARAWELTAMPSVAPHDSLGSHLDAHVYRNDQGIWLKRVVPSACEAVNEDWLSDRDRFSYTGLECNRLTTPQIRGKDGQLHTVSWETVLQAATEAFLHKPFGVLVHGNQSFEDFAAVRALADAIQTPHIDYRLTQLADVLVDPRVSAFADFSQADCIVLIATNLRKAQPLLAARLRRAVAGGAKVIQLGVCAYDQAMPTENIVVPLSQLAEKVQSLKSHSAVQSARRLRIVVGEDAESSEYFAAIVAAAQTLGGECAVVSIAANAMSALVAGVLPQNNGLSAPAMLAKPLAAYMLVNVGADDSTYPLIPALRAAEKVIVMASHRDEAVLAHADVVLPLPSWFEQDATHINVQGDCYAAKRVLPAKHDVRSVQQCVKYWLGDNWSLPKLPLDVDQVIVDRCRTYVSTEIKPQLPVPLTVVPQRVPYGVDLLVRNAPPLQKTTDARGAHMVRINADTAKQLGITDGDVRIIIDGHDVILHCQCVIDNAVAVDTVLLPPVAAAWCRAGEWTVKQA